MKKIIIAGMFLICFVAARAQEIVQLPIPKSGKVTLRYMFRNGSICDPAGKQGLTSITTDMIVESVTSKMSSTDIRKIIYPWSASMSSSTDKEVAIISFQVPSQYLDEFYTKVVLELLLHPSFTKSDFDLLLSNQQNYVEQVIRQSSDEELGKKYLESFIFRGTPYAQLNEGNVASVKTLTVEDAKKQYQAYFTNSNVLIGIAGDYPVSFVTKVKADAGLLSVSKPNLPQISMPAQPKGLTVEIVSKKGALGSAVSAGFPMNITRSNDEFAALMVANSWLGEHRKSYSRLYKKIREERSMNYGDYTYIEWYENGGGNMLPPSGTPRSLNYFSIWLRPVQTAKGLKGQYKELDSLKIGHAHYAIRMAIREMDNLIKNGLTAEDFEATRDFLKSYSKLYIETPSRKLGYMMDSKFYGRKDWINELDALLAKLTLADVNNAIKKYWQVQNMDIVIVTDESEVNNLAESLRAGTVSPMSYSDNLKATLPKVILEEDDVVAKYPLEVREVKVVKIEDTFLK
ncbi:MAG: insulinase family protein [Bacteroidetes bacterium]|nr:insulinase family protein [Bacteroidota bacterium]